MRRTTLKLSACLLAVSPEIARSHRFSIATIALGVCLSALTACNQKLPDYRVPANALLLNVPLTDALRKTGAALPAQVTSTNCYLPYNDRVLCDIELTEQAAREMGGQRTWEWTQAGTTISFADRNWDLGEMDVMGVDRFDALTDSHFQFIVRRGEHDPHPVVFANVNPSSVRFSDASGLVAAVMSRVPGSAGAVLDEVHAATPAAIRATWPAPGPMSQTGTQGAPVTVRDSQTSAGVTEDSNAAASAVGVRRSHGN